MSNIWEGNKIRLRAIEMSDLDGYFSERDVDGQRSGDRVTFPVSQTLMKDKVENAAKADPYGEEFCLIIEDFEGNAVGTINSHSCNQIDGIFEYGVGISVKARGKGYASEAMRLFFKFFFLELGYQKVESKVYSFNESSIKLQEKFGFVLEGKLRRHHFTLGKWHDAYCYGMTKEEFFDLYEYVI